MCHKWAEIRQVVCHKWAEIRQVVCHKWAEIRQVVCHKQTKRSEETEEKWLICFHTGSVVHISERGQAVVTYRSDEGE